MSEIAQILDQECTKILLRIWSRCLKGHFCSTCKNRLICCQHVDQPLFCHSIPSQLAQSFFSKPHPRYEILAPTGNKPIFATASNIGFHYPYGISLPPQPKVVRILVLVHAYFMSLDWFISLFQKIRKCLLNGLGFLSVVVTFLYSRRNLFCFVFFLPHHGNFVAPRWLVHPLLRGLVFVSFLISKLVNLPP